MGLTDGEKAAIEASWEIVEANKSTVGVALMLTLFEKHPGYMSKFRNLADIPSSELASHPKLRAHGITVLNMFTSFVKNLDDQDVFVELVKRNTYRHADRGVGKQEFDSMWALLPGFFSDQLGDKFDSQTAGAWTKALSVIQGITDDALAEK